MIEEKESGHWGICCRLPSLLRKPVPFTLQGGRNGHTQIKKSGWIEPKPKAYVWNQRKWRQEGPCEMDHLAYSSFYIYPKPRKARMRQVLH